MVAGLLGCRVIVATTVNSVGAPDFWLVCLACACFNCADD